MNILYLAHRIPYPPDKGDKLRSFRQIEHLAKRHRVYCGFFVDDARDMAHVPTLSSICADVTAVRLRRPIALARGLFGLATGTTLTESFYRNDRMARAVKRWSQSVRFDVVVAFSSSMAPYALNVAARRRVLDLCDLDSLKWRDYAERSIGLARYLYSLEGERLAWRERFFLGNFDATLLITRSEAAPLRGCWGAGSIHVVGNGVVLPAMRARDASRPTETGEPVGLADRSRTVGFVGVMSYRPNVDAVCWFVRRCWWRIHAEIPTARFRIIGRNPSRRVRELARIPGVDVVGAVDDIIEELRRIDVSVAPMRIARGLQNKVLEAMAAGKPVVLTAKAAEALDGRGGRDFIVADDAPSMATSILELFRDAGRRSRMGENARRFVAAHHRWEDALRQFELAVTGAYDRSADRCEVAAIEPSTLRTASAAKPAGVVSRRA